jgi:dTDP-4-amino-4,6-dideoxygalactose transaminase
MSPRTGGESDVPLLDLRAQFATIRGEVMRAIEAPLEGRRFINQPYYPLSLHEQECFASLGYRKGNSPESEKEAIQSIALPIHPELTEQQIEYVASQLREFVARPAKAGA